MDHKGRERGRLKIQWIMDNKKRKAALRRRLPILLKKVRELAILCGVPACLVVYHPGEVRPVAWPSRKAASEVLRKYRDLDYGRFKNKLDGLDFFKQINEKMEVRLSKVQRQARDEEIKLVIHDFLVGRRTSFNDLPTDCFVSLASKVETNLDVVKARLQELRSGRTPPPPTPKDVPMLVQPPVPHPMVATPLPPQNDGPTSMTLGSEPRHGSYLFETLDTFDVFGEGSGLPTTKEMHAGFVQTGIFSWPPSNPSFLKP